MTQPQGRSLPRSINHIGLSVPDLDQAVAWYTDVLGFRLIQPSADLELPENPEPNPLTDAFGPEFRSVRVAHLSTGNGTGIELFEFVQPAYERPEQTFDYRRGGLFHFCVTDPDVEGLAHRIAETGGKIRSSRVWAFSEDKPYRLCLCEDPFGIVIEIYSHSQEQTYANP
jgi:catechol 2,3-dioxygenase-like lactoylglutathione lyase family enzyme